MGAAASATAAPILYNINFTGGSPLPTSGQFTYDSATEQFSAFIVTWNAVSFNLTAAANDPNVTGTCNTAAANSADYFSYLNGNGCATKVWDGTTNLGLNLFFVGSHTATDRASAAAIVPMFFPLLTITSGGFTISEAPEPSSLVLMLAGGALVAWRRRNRNTHFQGTSQP